MPETADSDINISEKNSLKNSEQRRKEDFEIVFDYVPSISGYQMYVLLLGSLWHFAAGSIQLAQVILQATPDTKECVEWESSQGNLTDDGCAPEGVQCEKYNFTSQFFNNTVVTEWNLVCENSYKSSLISSLSLAGLLLGALIFGYLGDRIGRLNSMLISAIGATACVVLTSVTSLNLTSYTIFRIFAGCFIHGSVPTSCVYVMEYVGKQYRVYASSIVYMAFDFGIALLSLVGYYFQHWRHMNMSLAISPALGVLVYFALPKSIPLLYSVKDYKNGRYYLKNLMKRTKSDIKDLDFLSARLEKGSVRQNEQRMENRNSLMEIFSKNYLHMTWKISFTFFVACLANYGFLLNPAGLSGNFLINNVLLSFFDFLGYFIFPFVSNYFGRQKSLTVAFWMSGLFIIISAFLSIFYPDSSTVLKICNVLVFIGKIANSISFGIMFVYAAELYPTHLRTTIVGFGSAMARVGGILAPQIIFLQTINPLLHPLIIGSCAILAGIIGLRMPETNNRPLMQTTEEVLLFYKDENLM